MSNNEYALDLRSASGADESHVIFGQTMGLVAITSGLFALGAYLGRNMSYQWGWVWFIAAFVSLIAMNFATRQSDAGVGLLFAVGIFLGLAMSPTLAYYANADPQAVWQAGGATALFITGFGAAGYATRRDLSVLARGLFWALFALIGFGVVTIFAQIPAGAVVYSVLGLVIFAGFVMFDFQRLRASSDVSSPPQLAASIFLDILNVFTFFLDVFNGKR